MSCSTCGVDFHPPRIFIQGLPVGITPLDAETYFQHRESIKEYIREALRFVREIERENDAKIGVDTDEQALDWAENEIVYLHHLLREERGKGGSPRTVLMKVGRQVDMFYDELAFRAEGRF